MVYHVSRRPHVTQPSVWRARRVVCMSLPPSPRGEPTPVIPPKAVPEPDGALAGASPAAASAAPGTGTPPSKAAANASSPSSPALPDLSSLSPSQDAAVGALLGAAVGDAAGAPLECLSLKPTAEQVAWALTFPGGGVWAIAPGQVTDDTELSIAQADGLLALTPAEAAAAVENPPGSAAGLSPRALDSLAASYCAWMDSDPVDAGIATRDALRAEARAPGGGGAGVACAARAAASNSESKANGGVSA